MRPKLLRQGDIRLRKTNGSEAGGSDLVKAGGAFKLLNYLPKFLKILKTVHLGFRYRRIDRGANPERSGR